MAQHPSLILDLQKKYAVNGEAREIEVPEWGISVFVKPLTMGQLNALQTQAEGSAERAVLSVILRALDEDGKQLFSKRQKDALLNLPGAVGVIDRLATQIMEDVLAPEENP